MWMEHLRLSGVMTVWGCKVDLLLIESYCGTGGCSQKAIKEYGWFAFGLWKAIEIGFLGAPIDWAPPWFPCLVSPCSLFCGRAENNHSIPLLSVQTKQKSDSMLTYLKGIVYHLLAFISQTEKWIYFSWLHLENLSYFDSKSKYVLQ